MIDYWTALKGDGPAPSRALVDPAAFSDILTQAFMIGRGAAGAYPVRLAGALLEDLHKRVLLGSDFLGLWATTDRPRMAGAIESALRNGEALIAQALGRTIQGHQTKLEIVLAPLASADGQIDRVLGFYQPVSPLFRLQGEAIERLFLQDIAFADSGLAPPLPLRIAAVDGRRIA